jgi:NTP pyrophosphatase (non-canonical NTP hydrolase)
MKTNDPEFARNRTKIFEAIAAERDRQDAKYGTLEERERYNLSDWLAVLVGEVGEAAEHVSVGAHNMLIDMDGLRTELIQVAASALLFIEAIDTYPDSVTYEAQ